MAATDIVINFLGNAAGLNSAAGQASSGMQKFKQNVSRAAVGILGAATAMGVSAVNIASDTSESASKVATLFGKSATAVNIFAKNAAKAYGMSEREALSAVGAMGAVQLAMGRNAKESSELSLEYVRLSADLASFNNASSADVQEALTASLSGEYEMLKRYGIVVNDTTLKLEAQRQGMKKTGETWTSAQKLQLSHGIILKSTAKAQGDFARTSDGMANQTKIWSAQVTNLQGALGAKLLPAVVKVIGALNGAFDWMEQNQTTTKVLAVTIGGLAGAIVTLAIGMKIVSGVIALHTAAWRLLAIVMWANPVFIIAGIILAVGAAFVIAYKKSETFRNVVNKAFEGVKTFVISALQVLSGTLLGFWGMIISGAAKAFGWVPGIGDKLKTADREFTKFRDSVNAKLEGIKNPKPIHVRVTDDTAAAVRRVRNLKAQVEGGGWSIAIGTSGPQGIGVRLPARAAGGPVSANRAYLVGEHRPEVFVPRSSGTILPDANKVGALGGGPDVLSLTLDLGRGIREVVEIDLRERDRNLKRAVGLAGGRRTT